MEAFTPNDVEAIVMSIKLIALGRCKAGFSLAICVIFYTTKGG